MKRPIALACVAMLVLCFAAPATAITVRIMPDGSGDMADIQTALTSCVTGDTILVAPGIFTERLVWPETNGLVLMGETTAEECILDGSDSIRILTMLHPYDETTVIKGLTFQHGSSLVGNGGAILITAGSPLIEGNLFKDNLASGGGAIICVNGASPQIVGNIFTGNESLAHGGGGILVESGSNPTITDNHFWGNSSHYGGAIGVLDGANPIITENLIEANEAQDGGGLLFWGSPASCGGLVAYNTIRNNTATQAGGGILLGERIATTLHNNLISGNEADVSGGGIYCEHLENLAIIRSNLILDNSCGSGAGIAVREGAAPTIERNLIRGNMGDGIKCQTGANPLIQYNDIVNHLGYYGLINDDMTVMVMAENNFWGAQNGPYHPTLNPTGLGDWVSDNVDFDPYSITSGGDMPDLAARPVLHQNCPNPFNPKTIIAFTVATDRHVRLTVHAIDGHLVTTLLDGLARAGHNEVAWNGQHQDGRAMPSGVYFYRLTSGEFNQTNRMVLVR